MRNFFLPLPDTGSRIAPVFQEIERALQRTDSTEEDLEILAPRRLILRSPDGTRFAITVDNSGVVSGTALP